VSSFEKDCVSEALYCQLKFEHELIRLICKKEEINKQIIVRADPPSRGDLWKAITLYTYNE